MNDLKQKAKQLRNIIENIEAADSYIGMTKDEMVEGSIVDILEGVKRNATAQEKKRVNSIIKKIDDYVLPSSCWEEFKKAIES